MSRRLLPWLVLALALSPALAQEPAGDEQDAAAAAGEESPEEAAESPPPNEADLEAIERMLREDEEVLGGSGYSYDPGSRRDPFQSLLNVAEEPELLGPRPDGVPGLLIDEIEVTGVYVTADGPVAQVQAADKTKSFLLHKNDALYDGTVLDIRFSRGRAAEVVFRQEVRDPTSPKPFREVTKKLNP